MRNLVREFTECALLSDVSIRLYIVLYFQDCYEERKQTKPDCEKRSVTTVTMTGKNLFLKFYVVRDVVKYRHTVFLHSTFNLFILLL